MSKPILCVDFDGTIHPYSRGWVGATTIHDEPVVPGFFEWLFEAVEHFDVRIYSSRSRYWGAIPVMQSYLHNQLSRWLQESYAGKTADLAKLGHFRQTVMDLPFPTEKPAAFLTIDDRAYTFTGKWPDPVELLAFKPWNKK